MDPGDAVLEIGAGTGLLTAVLREAGASVAAAEIEPGLAGVLRERFECDPGVIIVEGDAFDGEGWTPPLRDAIRRISNGRPVRLISNLSYAIATKAVLAFIEDPEFEAGLSVVMLQRELADRLRAKPGDSDYGPASARVQFLARVEILRKAPPDVFWPRPRVESALVAIRPLESRLARLRHPAHPTFRDAIRTCFRQRRKILGSAARRDTGLPSVPEFLLRRRPDNVSPEEYWAWIAHDGPP